MGISIWQLVIILAIVLLLFGSKKLKNLGTDLGGAIRGFKKSIKDGESTESEESDKIENNNQSSVIEGEVTSKTKDKEKI